MKFDGRKLYEVYDRKTGRMLASGDVASCARKLEIGMPGFRLAANNPRHTKYIINHVATVRRIYSVYYNDGLIARGSLRQVAEELQCSKSAVESWGRMGQGRAMTVEVTEELEQTEEARELMNPCQSCEKDCEDGTDCKLWRDWWTKVYDQTRENIRKAAEKYDRESH